MSVDPRYPLGPAPGADVEITAANVETWIDAIAALPADLRRLVTPLDDAQLDTPYRDGGWTIRQLVHHVADSHLNSYVRFKWALTEERPTIKAYDQDGWATLADTRLPASVSLDLLEALHRRWVELLRSLRPEELGRVFLHPELGELRVGATIALYAWHGRHHQAHIERCLGRSARD